MPGKIFTLADMRYAEFNRLPRDKTLLLLAVSPVEVHGEHLPMKTDYFLAEGMLGRAAAGVRRRLPDFNIVMVPTLPLGADTLPLAGSLEIRPRVMRDVLVDIGSSFARHGFRYLALVSGHGGPRHDAAMELACQQVMARYPKMRMFTPTGELILYILLGRYVDDLKKKVGTELSEKELERLWPSDVHAGALETSLSLIFMPSLVSKAFKRLPPVEFGGKRAGGQRWVTALSKGLAKGLGQLPSVRHDRELVNRFFDNLAETINLWMIPQGQTPTYAGFPSMASKELGEAYLELIVDKGINLMCDVITGKRTVASTFTLFSKLPIMRASLYF